MTVAPATVGGRMEVIRMDDLIRRQDAIDAIYDGTPPEPHYPAWYVERIREVPAVKAEEQEDTE